MTFLHVTPVVGLPQVNGWSQVAENAHTSQNRIICVFAVEGSQAGNMGRDISEEIAQFTPVSFEAAYTFLKDLIDRFTTSDDAKLFLAAGIFIGSESAYATRGGSVFLKREGKIGTILHSRSDLKLVLGKRLEEDIIVLSTFPASRFLSEIELKFKTGFDTDTIITSIVPGVHSLDDSSLAALAFVVNSEKKVLEEDEGLLIEAAFEIDDEEDEPSEPEIESPSVSPDSISAPSSEALAELGLDKTEELPTETNPVVQKGASLLKKILFFIWKAARIIGSQVYRLVGGLYRRLRKLRLSQFHPENIHQKVRQNLALKGAYIGSAQQSKRRKMIAIVVIAILLVTGILYGWRLSVTRQRIEAQETLRSFSETMESAKLLVNENPVAARDSVAEAIRQLEALYEEQKAAGKNILANETLKQLEAAQQLHSDISGKEELLELPIFYDLRLVKADFLTSSTDSSGSFAAALDAEQKALIILNLEQKQPVSLNLDSLGSVRGVQVRAQDVLILADGIYSAPLDGSSPPTQIIAEGDSNREAQVLGAYERFIYVLNPSKRNVYRYAETDTGYSDPVGWMQAAMGLDYQTIASLAIDGELWMATNDGLIHRFASGRTAEFAIKGLPDEFSSLLKIATDEQQERLYVLEPEKRRIVILSKDGEFLREIKSGSLASAGNIFVSEKLRKVFAVSGSIIFEVSL